ncbi:chlorophyllase, alpha/beta hydrolase fold protein [Tanacetum coccineum]
MVLSIGSSVAQASTTCFDKGSYTVKSKRVSKSSGSTPNPPLYIVYPTKSGSYPVILFLHGLLIPNCAYSNLFEFISSHGYIIVAPGQTVFGFLTGLCILSAVGDVEDAVETANWINNQKGLQRLDPVEGSNASNRLEPKTLNYIPHDFNLAMPVALIGTGLGDDSFCGCIPPSAPWGCNHPFFFNECKPPSCYFVARDFGHLDMVDDWLVRLAGMFICKTGKGSKDDVRRACGGIFVAFLKAYMFHNADDLTAIIDSPNSVAPIKLDPVLWFQS